MAKYCNDKFIILHIDANREKKSRKLTIMFKDTHKRVHTSPSKDNGRCTCSTGVVDLQFSPCAIVSTESRLVLYPSVKQIVT